MGTFFLFTSLRQVKTRVSYKKSRVLVQLATAITPVGSQVGIQLLGTSASVGLEGIFNVHVHVLTRCRGNEVSLQLLSPQIFGFPTTALTKPSSAEHNGSLHLN